MLKFIFVGILVFISFLSKSQIHDNLIFSDASSDFSSQDKIEWRNIFVVDNRFKEFIKRGDTIIYDSCDNRIVEIRYRCISERQLEITAYYDNMQKFGEYNFIDNRKHGLFRAWYRNGQIRYSDFYDMGKFVCSGTSFYDNGTIETVYMRNYRDSQEVGGISIVFFPNSQIKYIATAFDNPKGFIEKQYYMSGQCSSIDTGNCGIREYVHYFENGELSVIGKYKNAGWYPVGPWNEWHPNGIKSVEYFYNDTIPNLRVGTWSWWDEQGNLTKQVIYENGAIKYTKEFVPNLGKDIEKKD